MVDALEDYRKAEKTRIERERREGRYRKVPSRRVDVAMLDAKQMAWSVFFPGLERLFHSPQRRRFSGHITTNGVSVSLGVVYPPSTGFTAQPPVYTPKSVVAAAAGSSKRLESAKRGTRCWM